MAPKSRSHSDQEARGTITAVSVYARAFPKNRHHTRAPAVHDQVAWTSETIV